MLLKTRKQRNILDRDTSHIFPLNLRRLIHIYYCCHLFLSPLLRMHRIYANSNEEFIRTHAKAKWHCVFPTQLFLITFFPSLWIRILTANMLKRFVPWSSYLRSGIQCDVFPKELCSGQSATQLIHFAVRTLAARTFVVPASGTKSKLVSQFTFPFVLTFLVIWMTKTWNENLRKLKNVIIVNVYQ